MFFEDGSHIIKVLAEMEVKTPHIPNQVKVSCHLSVPTALLPLILVTSRLFYKG
jgi:hypothetical protein